MKKTSEPIIFFGSGPVGAESLESLSRFFSVSAVVTKPAPPKHSYINPVIKIAENLSLDIFTVSDKLELNNLFNESLHATRLGVLVDFGIIITSEVIRKFDLGIVNSHFSLLPEWRGADPITFSLLSGQHKTGVSLMILVEKMDEGPILSTEELIIPKNTYVDQLTEKLIITSNELLNESLPSYIDGKIEPLPQNKSIKPTYSRKITKSDGKIDWNKPAEVIEREIRAFYTWPKSYAKVNGLDIIITEAEVIKHNGEAGTAICLNNDLVIYCGLDALKILKLKPAGKPNMSVGSFLAGYKIKFLDKKFS